MPTDYIKINIRRGSTADWEKEDPVLALGEIAADTTKHLLKVGNGTSVWSVLPYYAVEVVDDLTTGGTDKALSAEQGKELKALINELSGMIVSHSASKWTTDNPILDKNVIGYDETNNRIKLGNGTTYWNALPYVAADSSGGTAGTIEIGTVTSGAAGSSASVTNVGTPSAAVLNFVIPRGDTGTAGVTPTIKVGTTTTGAAGTNASVTATTSGTTTTLNFVIPRGDTGTDGVTPTIQVGTTTTGAAGTNASVTAATSGTTTKLNFTIPRGNPGPSGTSGYSTESWTFTLENGSTVAKMVVLS